MMNKTIIAVFLLGLSATIVQAFDMQDLAPCEPAAARFCDRSGGMNWSNLVRCGATLAAHSFRVGSSCREVLRRYGQL
jgi:hypothetical protein